MPTFRCGTHVFFVFGPVWTHFYNPLVPESCTHASLTLRVHDELSRKNANFADNAQLNTDMNKLKLLTFFILLCNVFAMSSCSDENDGPVQAKNNLVGYWAISHVKVIEHTAQGHDTYDKTVPPMYLDSYVGEEQPRWNVLIFDEEFVTVRGDMPNCPKRGEYEDDINGDLNYNVDLENWNESIGAITDSHGCPVGKYAVKNNHLTVGTLDMGTLTFSSSDEFTLDYTKSIGNSGDYRRLVYTYTRIYSLTR